MSFFDTTPAGRILNYFSTDLDTADGALPLDVQLWLISMTSLLSTIITIWFAKPEFLAIILPILAVNAIVQVISSDSSRIIWVLFPCDFDFRSAFALSENTFDTAGPAQYHYWRIIISE